MGLSRLEALKFIVAAAGGAALAACGGGQDRPVASPVQPTLIPEPTLSPAEAGGITDLEVLKAGDEYIASIRAENLNRLPLMRWPTYNVQIPEGEPLSVNEAEIASALNYGIEFFTTVPVLTPAVPRVSPNQTILIIERDFPDEYPDILDRSEVTRVHLEPGGAQEVTSLVNLRIPDPILPIGIHRIRALFQAVCISSNVHDDSMRRYLDAGCNIASLNAAFGWLKYPEAEAQDWIAKVPSTSLNYGVEELPFVFSPWVYESFYRRTLP